MEKARSAGADMLNGLRSRLDGSEPALADGAKASVAIVLALKGDEVYVLLIKRAERKGDTWSGHVAFPGGHRDAEDTCYRGTAERETREELGFDLAKSADFLGYWKPMKTHTGDIMVVPSVFLLRSDVDIKPSSSEVSSYKWVPLRDLLDERNKSTYLRERDGRKESLPSIVIGDYIVWGLTHAMIHAVLDGMPDANKPN